MSRMLLQWSLSLASFSLAVGLHVGAFAVLVGDNRQHGLVESEVASVSMNLLEAEVLEDIEQGDPEDAPASTIEQTASVAGAKEEAQQQPKPEPEKQPEVEPEKNLPAKESEQQKVQPEKQASLSAEEKEVTSAAPPRPRKKLKPRPARAGSKESRQASKSHPARKKGAQRGQARGPRSQSSGSRTASLGDIRAYAGLVNARIASRSPSGYGTRGVVMVAFAVSSSGGLRYARVTRSSGNRTLDTAALSAVRRAAPFPRPPAGTSARQLMFSIPFRFK